MQNILIAFFERPADAAWGAHTLQCLSTDILALANVDGFPPRQEICLDLCIQGHNRGPNGPDWQGILCLINSDDLAPSDKEEDGKRKRNRLKRLRRWYVRRFHEWRGRRLFTPPRDFLASFGRDLPCPFRRGFRIAFSAYGGGALHSLMEPAPDHEILSDIVFSRHYQDASLFGNLSECQVAKQCWDAGWRSPDPPLPGNRQRERSSRISVYFDPATAHLPDMIKEEVTWLSQNGRGFASTVEVVTPTSRYPVKLEVEFLQRPPGVIPPGENAIFVTDQMPPEESGVSMVPIFRTMRGLLPRSSHIGAKETPRTVVPRVVVGAQDEIKVRKQGNYITCPPNSLAIWDCVWECVTDLLEKECLSLP